MKGPFCNSGTEWSKLTLARAGGREQGWPPDHRQSLQQWCRGQRGQAPWLVPQDPISLPPAAACPRTPAHIWPNQKGQQGPEQVSAAQIMPTTGAGGKGQAGLCTACSAPASSAQALPMPGLVDGVVQSNDNMTITVSITDY